MCNDNRCICCGAPIPEGRQVCPECERRVCGEQDTVCYIPAKY